MTKLNGLDLLMSGDDDAAEMSPVATGQRINGLDLLMAGDEPQRQQAPPPKQEGWGEWIVNSVRGRQDPREAGTGTVYDQFPKELHNPTANAAIFGADDAAMGDIVAKTLGPRVVRREKDANGYDVFVTQGPDGKEQRGYLNKPGLDMQDVARGVRGALPYAVTGGAAGAIGRGLGVGVNMLMQGGAAGVTSVGGDLASGAIGSDQGIDAEKAVVNTGLGVAGPAVGMAAGALWRKFVTIPGLIDQQTGQLTAKGIDAARQAGIDPADITPDFAKQFSQSLATTGNPAEAATRGVASRFGIPATRGQMTKDPYLLTQEEAMRRRLYGETAQDTMLGFDKQQEAAIKAAALGDDSFNAAISGAPRTGIGAEINPVRAGHEARLPSALGENIQDGLQEARRGARAAESALWDDNVKNLASTPEAMATLPGKINSILAEETAFTKTGQAMAEALDGFMSGKVPKQSVGAFETAPVKSVDQMRRRLGSLVGEAEPGTDKNQAGKIYDAFNDWIGESAKSNLLAGDPAAAMQLVKARGFTKEVRALFEPRGSDGKVTPAASRLAKVLDDGKADSGEAVINALLGSQGSRSAKDGTVAALANIKTALDRFAGKDQAALAWNDIRLAYWTRLVTNKTGDVAGPAALVGNLKAAFNGQRSVINVLYTPKEQRQMREFLRAVEVVAYRPPNASGSGYTAASLIKDGLIKFLDAFGLGAPARAAIAGSGIEKIFGAGAARKAVDQMARPVRPNITPAIVGVGQSVNGDQPSR